jgi:hypothetical protein
MAREILKADDRFTVKEADLNLTIPPDPEVTYTLRPLLVSKARELTKTNTRRVPDPATRRMVDETNDEALQIDFLDYILVDWSGVTSDGVALPCTRDFKQALPGTVQGALIERAQVGASAQERFRESREPAGVR